MNDMTKIVKQALFWPQIKRRLIIRKHKSVSKYCRQLISEYQSNTDKRHEIKALKIFGSEKIIWQYWSQGFNDELPELVRLCLESIERNCGDAKIIRLSDDNISEYLDIPDFILKNKNRYPKAIFSDLLRCLLLSAYGGCWLDATIFLSGVIPQKYWDYDFFLFQRSFEEQHKKYWANAFYYYFGWEKDFLVRSLNSIIFSKKGNHAINLLTQLLLFFWQKEEDLPDYFFFQILFNELVKDELIDNCTIENDCIPHLLQQYFNDQAFTLMPLAEILKTTSIHKLTYKVEVSDKLKILIKF